MANHSNFLLLRMSFDDFCNHRDKLRKVTPPRSIITFIPIIWSSHSYTSVFF
jgi:hypothetical protein